MRRRPSWWNPTWEKRFREPLTEVESESLTKLRRRWRRLASGQATTTTRSDEVLRDAARGKSHPSTEEALLLCRWLFQHQRWPVSKRLTARLTSDESRTTGNRECEARGSEDSAPSRRTPKSMVQTAQRIMSSRRKKLDKKYSGPRVTNPPRFAEPWGDRKAWKRMRGRRYGELKRRSRGD